MAESAPARATLRRDAHHNRDRVIAAAEQVFARLGLDAPLEEIAAVAGVSPSTLYRRFPTKTDLADAVFSEKIEASVELVTECRKNPSAWEGLCTLLRRTIELEGNDRGLHEFIHTPSMIGSRVHELKARATPIIAELVAGAKKEGALREDFSVIDLQMIGFMVSRLAHHHPELGPRAARRYLEFLIKGLAPNPDLTEVPPALDDNAFLDWIGTPTHEQGRRS